MKFRSSVVCVLLILIVSVAVGAEDTRFMLTESFEAFGGEDQMPDDWAASVVSGTGEIRVDLEESYTGKSSVKLEATSDTTILSVKRVVEEITPEGTYVLSGWYKTDGSIVSRDELGYDVAEVMLRLTCADKNLNPIVRDNTPVVLNIMGDVHHFDWGKILDTPRRDVFGKRLDVYGAPQGFSNEWVEIAGVLTLPEETEVLIVEAMLYNSQGTVWFDDIKLVEAENLLENASFETGDGKRKTLRDIAGKPKEWDAWIPEGKGEFQLVEDVALQGKRSQKMSGLKEDEPRRNAVGIHSSTVLAFEEGDKYLFSIWFYTPEDVVPGQILEGGNPEGISNPLHLRPSALDYNEQPRAEWHMTYPYNGTGGQWKVFNVPITMAKNIENFWTWFFLTNATGTVYLDNASFVKFE